MNQNNNVTNDADKTVQDVSPPNDDRSDLRYFHLTNEKGAITGVFDVRITDYIKDNHPLIMVGKLPYIYEHGYFKPDYTGAKLKSLIKKYILPAYIKSTTIKRIFDLFVADYELQTVYKDLNQYSNKYINFRNGMFDPVSWKMLKHSPKYKSINQIPYKFYPNQKPERNLIDDFLEKVIPDVDDREMVLEYFGLCFTKDRSQQKFLVFVGTGGTGKSTLISMIENAVGEDNLSNVSLKGLSERFATADLVGKLLNSCADLEERALDDPAVLKKLLGEDRIHAERKGKDPFDFKNYAKLIFSSNDIPVITGERSDGFYRRLLICPMNEKPAAVDPELFDKLKKCMPRFIYLCMRALKNLYVRKNILKSLHSIQLCEQLRNDSDSVQGFLNESIENDPESKMERGLLYSEYHKYCYKYDRTALTKNRFYSSMRAKGYQDHKSNGEWYFLNVRLRLSFENVPENDSNRHY